MLLATLNFCQRHTRLRRLALRAPLRVRFLNLMIVQMLSALAAVAERFHCFSSLIHYDDFHADVAAVP